MKNKILAMVLFGTAGLISTAQAEYILNPNHQLKIGVGGYARIYTGKMESYQYNNIFKAEPVITAQYELTDTLALKGKFAYRIVRNDRFADRKTSKVYDAFITLDSKKAGKLDVGKLRSVAYLLHQGSVDVSCLDVEDSDISYFYQKPKDFYAPMMTYLYTDSRDPKINYTTPDIGGFKAGVTVVQSEDKKADSIAPQEVKVDHGKGILGGIQYKQNLNEDLWVALSGGLAFYQNNRFYVQDNHVDANHREYSLGSKIGYQGLTVGMSYRRLMFPDKV